MSATATPQAAQDSFRPGGWSPRLVMNLVILVLITEVSILVNLYPVNALGLIGAEFRTDQVAWIAAIVSLGAVVSPIVGKLADRHGKKKVLVLVLMLASVGLLISAFAPNYALLVVGRLLQAATMSIGFLIPSLVRDIFPTKTIPLAASISMTGAGLFTVISQLFVAPILTTFGWRGTFWIPAVLGMVLVVLVLVLVPESSVREHGSRIDFVGATLIGLGIGGILLGISFGGTWGWTSAAVLCAFAVGVLSLVGWVMQSLRAKEPLVDIREISHTPILMSILIGSIAAAMSSWFYAILPIIALSPSGDWGLGLEPVGQGYIAALWSLGGGIGGFLGGFALSRLPGPRVIIVEMTVLTLMFLLVFSGLSATFTISIASFFIGMMAAGLVSGAMYMIMRLVAQQRQAVVSSVTMLSIGVVSGILPVVLFAVMNALGSHDDASGVVTYSVGSMAAATLIPSALGVIGVILAVVLAIKVPKEATIPTYRLAAQNETITTTEEVRQRPA